MVVIMNTNPPKDVGIWAAFSVSNCGYSAPNPSASAAIANVSRMIVTTLTDIMKGVACSRMFVKIVMVNATTSSGMVPIQYFDHNKARKSSGLDRRSHICLPSSEIDGKMKRAAIEASTNPARPRFKNEMTETRKNGTCSPRNSGKARMLNR